jgi:hypothetical protein
MTTQSTFTLETIKGNSITWMKKVEISNNGKTVTVEQYKNEPASVWVSTSTTFNRIGKDLSIEDAIILANNLLSN